jgi:hypothetical protein
MVERPCWLIVVRRDKPRLYEILRKVWEGDPMFEVVLDRREGAEPGKHATERRRALTPEEQEMWETVGFRLVYRG